MKITCTRVDEVNNRREIYDDRINALKKSKEGRDHNYRVATRRAQEAVAEKAKQRLGKTFLPLNVTASWPSELWSRSSGSNYSLRFDCETDGDSRSIRWEIELEIVDGELRKKSNSWSGLSATTEDQLADLRECVRIIEKINYIDWTDLLNSEAPVYEDYSNDEEDKELYSLIKERPDFDSELKEARAEEAARSGKWFYGQGAITSSRHPAFRFACKVVSETPKYYNAIIVPLYDSREDFTQAAWEANFGYDNPEKCLKSKLGDCLDYPVRYAED